MPDDLQNFMVAPDIYEVTCGQDLDKIQPDQEKKFHFAIPVLEYRSVMVTAKTFDQAVAKAKTMAKRRYDAGVYKGYYKKKNVA